MTSTVNATLCKHNTLPKQQTTEKHFQTNNNATARAIGMPVAMNY
jgi:hypothetical protein